MSIMDFLPRKRRNEAIAEYLFSERIASTRTSRPRDLESWIDLKNQKAADKISARCKDRQDLFDEIIRLCSPADNPKRRYLTAKAHAWSRVSHRAKAIESLNTYLNNPLYEKKTENMPGDSFICCHEVNRRDIHLSEMYGYLGKAYEGEHDFDNALAAYTKANKYTPFYAHTYCWMANIYRKMNDLPSARKVYEDAQKSIYYPPFTYYIIDDNPQTDDGFKTIIDCKIEEIDALIQKGYIYKPRKRKQ